LLIIFCTLFVVCNVFIYILAKKTIMVRSFYIQKGKEDIMFEFKEHNERLGLNYSATLVELMEQFNNKQNKKNGSNNKTK
jgi:phage-related holin